MILRKTKIEGLVILKPEILFDERGYFTESFNQIKINDLLGEFNFVQSNESMSFKCVLRGLHFQNPPHSQAKLVRCTKGKVLDVALDLRKNSKTYGQFESTILSHQNKNQLFIPKGFAHGFLVLSNSAIISYKVDNYYNHESESGIIWNDPNLNIDWKMKKSEIIISEKDSKLRSMNSFTSPF